MSNHRIAFVILLLLWALTDNLWAGVEQDILGSRGRIQGRVVDADSGEALSNANVIIRGLRGEDHHEQVADAAGLFAFDAVTPSVYFIEIDRVGYVQQNVRQTTSVPHISPASTTRTVQREGAIALQLAAGGHSDLEFRLTRAAMLTGRIDDEEGRPVARAEVELLAAGFDPQNGNRVLRTARSVSPVFTNSDGAYEFSDLLPGVYYIRASIASHSQGRTDSYGRSEDSSIADPMSVTYYPGVSRSDQAAPIQVLPGAEVHAIDFDLLPVFSTRVSGHVINTLAFGDESSGYSFYLVAANTSQAEPPRVLPNHSGRLGEFELRNVPPGDYDLYVVFSPNTRDGRKWRPHAGRAFIRVGNEDLSGLALVIEPNIDVMGHIVLHSSASTFDLSRIRPVPEMSDTRPAVLGLNSLLQLIQPVQTDGTFLLPSVTAGQYRARILEHTLPPGVYLASARLGSQNVFGLTFDVNHQSNSPLILELKGDGARLSGTVVDRGGLAVADATVVLIPPSYRRDDPAAYRSVKSDEKGEFALEGIHPGEYTVLSFEQIEYAAWLNAAFIAPHLGRGVNLSFQANQSVDRTLTLIPER